MNGKVSSKYLYLASCLAVSHSYCHARLQIHGGVRRGQNWLGQNFFVSLYSIFLVSGLIGRAKRALHTSESQLRSDMYICLYHQKFKGQSVPISLKVNACPFPAAMFKLQH